MNNTTGSLNRMMNNFMSEGNEEDKENGNGSNIVKNYRNSNGNIPLPSASKLPVGRPRSNQSSDLKTKIFNKRTSQNTTNMGYGTMNGFMRDQPKVKRDIKEQVKSFQNFSNPWANSSFKSNEMNSEQAQPCMTLFKAKKPKKNSITSSDRRILSKLTTNTFSIRGNSPGGRLIYK